MDLGFSKENICFKDDEKLLKSQIPQDEMSQIETNKAHEDDKLSEDNLRQPVILPHTEEKNEIS